MPGIFKKVVKGGLIVGAGIVAYKVIQKLNIGSVTQNLHYPDNVVPYLKENSDAVPKVKMIRKRCTVNMYSVFYML